MRSLHQVIFEDEKDATISGETGHWITVHGRPIFIGEPSMASKRLSTLDPEKMERGRQILTIKVKDKSGATHEVKKYVYSDKWNQATTRYKFAIVNEIEKQRPKIEGALEAEVGAWKTGAPLALCALVIARTGMRVGQPGNATKNETGESEETYGATTLERRHVTVDGDTVTFAFRGKSGVSQNVVISDKVIAGGVRRILAEPGREDGPLFTKVDSKKQSIALRREDVADRFKRFNEHYKPKDFRTAVAMRAAVDKVQEMLGGRHALPSKAAEQKKYAKALVKELGEAVSGKLGNTPAVAISNYTNPLLVEYLLKQMGLTKVMLEGVCMGGNEVLVENIGNIAAAGGTPEDVPLLVAMYGREKVQAWFSELSKGLTGGAEETDIDLVEA